MEEKITKPNLSRKDLVLIVLAILAIAWAIYFFMNKEEVVDYAPAITRTNEKLAPGFPEIFLIEKDINLKESALLTYSTTGDKLWNVTYPTSLKPADLLLKYESYFKENGWNITNSEPDTLIFGIKDKQQVSVYIKQDQGQNNVLVTVLERK